ncbi:Transcription initiation factor TFIID subunit 14 [Penicillium diatomitis]|uniref:Transcription initiation factor TFIID subunit 14 n=1 Tax=Penicillium diatomitis TaxID=2819901 RepID=A0A9W9XCT0_9EURO|nr:Transcription initiation factor TFIID subunit 14 [Penicillium diatomitis]KAJ5489005.1 Transcription initiation factor TFIID subunit 14 [Penicillium diatomitis]
MPEVKRNIRIVTEQHIIDKPSDVEGFPQRAWSIEIFLVNDKGEQVPASIFDKVIYRLHPSFGDRANQSQLHSLLGLSSKSFQKTPFRIQEEGWGEFDMTIDLVADKTHTIRHDLNFAQERYEAKHTIANKGKYYQTFRNPKPAFLALLRESGPVPGDENGVKGKRGATGEDSVKKKKRTEKNVDMDKLADGLQKLNEDDLLQVVQMVHDNKSADSYTKNDAELGEFHVDLYTLPDALIKMLWEFTAERGAL